MKYVMAFSNARGPQRLEPEATRESVTNECREAALAFMAGVAAGWDKLDLVLWLTGPYARATRHAGRGERNVAVTGDEDDHEISEETLEDVMTRARQQVMASLEGAVLDLGTLDFADDSVERGLVRRAIDGDGRVLWVPVDGPRMRLRDRVRALFAADYLDRPYDYAGLFVCHRCEAIVFDEAARRIGICGAHRLSGVVAREDGEPISFPQAVLARG